MEDTTVCKTNNNSKDAPFEKLIFRTASEVDYGKLGYW